MTKFELPIKYVLGDIQANLKDHVNLVIAAPPGAGKTTAVPLELLKADWLGGGKIILIEPRRLAARGAAARMADLLGEKIGETIGYRMRLDTKVSGKTKIEVVTEGVFSRMVLDDPELSGIACVIFDEFHERALEADFGLALALDVQGALREDLRLIIMSATLDIDEMSRILPNAKSVVSEGRTYPVDIRHQPRQAKTRIENVMADAIMNMHQEEQGSILAFLPGQGEIKRTYECLDGKFGADTDIFMLYGSLSMGDQVKAVRAPEKGRRKIVLATSIAETSITIEGVRVVIDSGLQREALFEASTGMTRLETNRASQASTIQRAGRAGRVEPGIALRLWQKEQQAALPKFSQPQILQSDLSDLVLDCLQWGVKNVADLNFVTPPPQTNLNAGFALLKSVGAVDEQHNLMALGRSIQKLSLPIRLSAMVIKAAERGCAQKAARLAILMTEQGLSGSDIDLDKRLDRFAKDHSPRAKSARNLANRLAKRAESLVEKVLFEKVPCENLSSGAIFALAFSDRIAKQRAQIGHFTMANGRGAVMDETEPLAREDMLVVADLTGKAAAPRILSAVRICMDEVMLTNADQLKDEAEYQFDKESRTIRARKVTKLGAIKLKQVKLPKPTGPKLATALADAVKQLGLSCLDFPKSAQALRIRSEHYRASHPADDTWPNMSDGGLLASMEHWFEPFQTDIRSIKDIDRGGLANGIKSLLTWEQMNELDQKVPAQITLENGRAFELEYRQGDVVLSVRAQQLYGQKSHPCILNGTLPLLVELLSPAERPVQLTRDLPNFWQGSWKDVRADMRARYPKHDWPENPAEAQPKVPSPVPPRNAGSR